MKIIVIGARGDIGRAVCAELGSRHDIVTAGRSSGDLVVDIADPGSVRAMYDAAGPVDAVVCAGGDVRFAPLAELTPEDALFSLSQKAAGQINVVLIGQTRLADRGSFTLTSGILDRDPIRAGTGAAMANGALAGFVKSAAIELERGVRINVVSPGLLDVSVPRYGAFFPGHEPVAATRVGRAYAKSVEGALTGQVITVD